MLKKARIILNLLQNYKKIGENLHYFREILYFCIKKCDIFAFRLRLRLKLKEKLPCKGQLNRRFIQ